MTSKKTKNKKDQDRGNNLLNLDKNANFMKKTKNVLFLHTSFSDFKKTIKGQNFNKWAKLIMHLPKKTPLYIYYSLLEQNKIGGIQLVFSCNDQQIFSLLQISRGEEMKRWHKERVAPEFQYK